MSYSDATPDHGDIVIPVVPTANPGNSSTSAATTDHHVDENASPESTSSNVHSPSVDPDMSIVYCHYTCFTYPEYIGDRTMEVF